jgi:hypothetical protein
MVSTGSSSRLRFTRTTTGNLAGIPLRVRLYCGRPPRRRPRTLRQAAATFVKRPSVHNLLPFVHSFTSFHFPNIFFYIHYKFPSHFLSPLASLRCGVFAHTADADV